MAFADLIADMWHSGRLAEGIARWVGHRLIRMWPVYEGEWRGGRGKEDNLWEIFSSLGVLWKGKGEKFNFVYVIFKLIDGYVLFFIQCSFTIYQVFLLFTSRRSAGHGYWNCSYNEQIKDDQSISSYDNELNLMSRGKAFWCGFSILIMYLELVGNSIFGIILDKVTPRSTVTVDSSQVHVGHCPHH